MGCLHGGFGIGKNAAGKSSSEEQREYVQNSIVVILARVGSISCYLFNYYSFQFSIVMHMILTFCILFFFLIVRIYIYSKNIYSLKNKLLMNTKSINKIK